jgi:hypothetical protein
LKAGDPSRTILELEDPHHVITAEANIREKSAADSIPLLGRVLL